MESFGCCLINFLLKLTLRNNLTLKLLYPYRQLIQETHNKSITEVMETSDAAAQEANQSEQESEIVTDEYKNRKIIAAEVLKKINEVKNFIEVNGSDHLNMIFNELIENVEKMKLKIKNKVILEVSLDLKIYFIYTAYQCRMKKSPPS